MPPKDTTAMEQQGIKWIAEGGPWALVVVMVVGGGWWLTRYLFPRWLDEMKEMREAAQREREAATKAQAAALASFRDALTKNEEHYLQALAETHKAHRADSEAQRLHDAERHQQLAAALERLSARVDALAGNTAAGGRHQVTGEGAGPTPR